MRIYIDNTDNRSRTGRVILPNRKKLRFPILWFSVWIDDEIRKRYQYFTKKEFREALFINAYHILTRPHIRKITEGRDIHKLLRFEGPIIADSGGFIFRNQTKLSFDPLALLRFYETSKVDIGLVLDHPPDPKSLNDENTRIKTTLKNTILMFENKQSSDLLLLPVVSSLSIEKIRDIIRAIRRVWTIEGICIGGLVPLIRTQIPNGRKLLVELLIMIRRLLPDSFIHVLGVGGTTTMHLMYYLGVDSVDSCAWEKKAAYGLIQLPKVGDRFIIRRSKRKRYPTLSTKEYEMLLECQCPVCKKHPPEDLDVSRDLRVVHNAWVFQNEVKEAREMIRKREYEEFVEERLRCSNMYSTFKYARMRLHEMNKY